MSIDQNWIEIINISIHRITEFYSTHSTRAQAAAIHLTCLWFAIVWHHFWLTVFATFSLSISPVCDENGQYKMQIIFAEMVLGCGMDNYKIESCRRGFFLFVFCTPSHVRYKQNAENPLNKTTKWICEMVPAPKVV